MLQSLILFVQNQSWGRGRESTRFLLHSCKGKLSHLFFQRHNFNSFCYFFIMPSFLKLQWMKVGNCLDLWCVWVCVFLCVCRALRNEHWPPQNILIQRGAQPWRPVLACCCLLPASLPGTEQQTDKLENGWIHHIKYSHTDFWLWSWS